VIHLLELRRTYVSDRRVPPDSIVEHFDVLADRIPSAFSSSVAIVDIPLLVATSWQLCLAQLAVSSMPQSADLDSLSRWIDLEAPILPTESKMVQNCGTTILDRRPVRARREAALARVYPVSRTRTSGCSNLRDTSWGQDPLRRVSIWQGRRSNPPSPEYFDDIQSRTPPKRRVGRRGSGARFGDAGSGLRDVIRELHHDSHSHPRHGRRLRRAQRADRHDERSDEATLNTKGRRIRSDSPVLSQEDTVIGFPKMPPEMSMTS
jgi:hypothetical protein